MRYLSVTEIAKKWDVSERSVRNYCAQGRVNGAFLTGKTWNIPENAEKPTNDKRGQGREKNGPSKHHVSKTEYLRICRSLDDARIFCR